MSTDGSFEITVDTTLGAPPERVWKAVTEAEPAWMFPTDDWEAERVVNDYPRHHVSRMEGPDGWFNQLEHVLTPVGDDACRLHYVHSGIFVDNWDEQYDGASAHTAFYLHTLDQYLRHFDGLEVGFTDIQAPAASQGPGGFTRLLEALGAGAAAQGDRLVLALPGEEPAEVEVDYRAGHFLGLRSADTLYRFFGRNAWGAPVGITVHRFRTGAAAPAAVSPREWEGFFDKVYS
ncbi:SRPBCC family protein [Arthrobacter sp. TMN-37]